MPRMPQQQRDARYADGAYSRFVRSSANEQKEESSDLMACSRTHVRVAPWPEQTDGCWTMSSIVKGTVLLAAVLFIGISASMNALFLSSFGRSPIETGLLTAVSIAGDVVKAVLPVVLARTIAQRAWGQTSLCGVMLAVAIAMSVASGLGFAAGLRSEAVTVREGASAVLKAREADLADIEQRLAALSPARTVPAITTDIDAAKFDRAWAASKACTQATGLAMRQFCERVVRLRGELAAATERDRYHADRRMLREAIGELRKSGSAADADPQASALAELLGTDRKTPRMLVTTAMALVLELGSIVLILLAAGSALRGWHEPGREPRVPEEPVVVPASADRTHWHRQRQHAKVLPANRGVPHVSSG